MPLDTATAADVVADAKAAFEQIDTLHELLDVAIRANEALLGNPLYEFDMGDFHAPGDTDAGQKEGICYVCAAGSVMAGMLGCKPDADLWPDELGILAARRLYAIDMLRCGYIKQALAELHATPAPSTWRLRWLAKRWGSKMAWQQKNDTLTRYGMHNLLRQLRVMRDELKAHNL